MQLHRWMWGSDVDTYFTPTFAVHLHMQDKITVSNINYFSSVSWTFDCRLFFGLHQLQTMAVQIVWNIQTKAMHSSLSNIHYISLQLHLIVRSFLTSLCSASYISWQRGTAHIRPPPLLQLQLGPAVHATVNWYLLHTWPTAANPLQRCAVARWDGQTDYACQLHSPAPHTMWAVPITFRFVQWVCVNH